MVRRSRLAVASAIACAIFAAACARSACAQALPRLDVVSFTMHADTQAPRLGQVFHVEIAGRLKERLTSIDFVVLPNLFGLEPLGDERRAIATATGTVFSETLTVTAAHAGRIDLGGAYFDAIDVRDGKPKRYYSNDLVVNVIGAPAASNDAGSLRAFLMKLVGALLLVFLAGAFLFRKRPNHTEPAVPVAPAAVVAPQSENPVRDALEVLKHARHRSAVMSLRYALWKSAGARGGETLSDLVSRNGIATNALRGSLHLVERAAFVADSRLSDAIDDAIRAVEEHLA